jgi:hypothetical protein
MEERGNSSNVLSAVNGLANKVLGALLASERLNNADLEDLLLPTISGFLFLPNTMPGSQASRNFHVVV